jgi:hypothetical protein
MATNEHVFAIGESVVMKPSHPTHGGKHGVVVDFKLINVSRIDGCGRCVEKTLTKAKVRFNGDGITTSSQLSWNFGRVSDIPLNEKRKAEKDRSVTYQKMNCKKWNEPTGNICPILWSQFQRDLEEGDGFKTSRLAPRSIKSMTSNFKKNHLESFCELVKADELRELGVTSLNHPTELTREQVDVYYNKPRAEALLKGEDTHRLNSTMLKYWVRFCENFPVYVKRSLKDTGRME